MPTLDQYPPSEKLRCLVFAPYKGYKTSGAGTFPRPNFLDFDRGLSVLKADWWRKRYGIDSSKFMYETFVEDTENVNVRGIVTKPTSFQEANRYIELCTHGGEWKGQHVGPEMFDSWILDSATTMFESSRNLGVYLLSPGKMNAKGYSPTFKKAEETGLVHPIPPDFGAERSMAEQMIDKILRTDKHFALLCHSKEEEVPDSEIGTKRIVPLLTGQSVNRVCVKFEEIWYITTTKRGNEVTPILQTRGNSAVRCGTRYGLPDGTEWSWQAITTALKPLGFDLTGSAAPSLQPEAVAPTGARNASQPVGV